MVSIRLRLLNPAPLRTQPKAFGTPASVGNIPLWQDVPVLLSNVKFDNQNYLR